MLVADGLRFATSARSPNPCPTTSLKPRQTCQRIWGANRQASDHELAEPLSVGVAGGLGILLKPFRCSLDSSFIAFSTARSIPRSPNPQATTTAAQSRTKRAIRRCCSSAADDDWGGLRESKEKEIPRQIFGRTSASVQPIDIEPGLDRLVDPLDQVREQFGTVLKPDSPSLMFEPTLRAAPSGNPDRPSSGFQFRILGRGWESPG